VTAPTKKLGRPSTFGEPTENVMVRFPASLFHTTYAAAEAAGCGMSQYIRDAVVAAMERDRERQRTG